MLMDKRVISLLLILLVFLAFWARDDEAEGEVRHIAYVGRYTNPDFDRMHEVMLQTYLDRISEKLDGVRLELEPFDIDNRWENSVRAYEGPIADDPLVWATIDNAWGEHIQPAAAAIRGEGLPVISLNADTGSVDFGPTALFLGNEDTAPRAITSFVQNVLEADRVLLIGEENYAMTEEFIKRLAPQWELSVPTADFSEPRWGTLKEELRAYLEDAGDGVLVVMSTHRYWGNPIVEFIDEIGRNVDIVGNPSTTSSERSVFGENDHGNRLILLTRPADALPKDLNEDLAAFTQDYPQYFDASRFNTALFIRRCRDAAQVLESILLEAQEAAADEQESIIDRGVVAQGIEGILASEGLVLDGEVYAFSPDGGRVREFQFELYEAGGVSSYPYQLNNLLQKIPSVSFGVEVIDINSIDPASGSFQADFYYWQVVPKSHVHITEAIHFKNLRGLRQRAKLIETEEGETVHRLYRVSGEFQADYDLNDFPMDSQELVLSLEMTNDTDEVRASFDQGAFDAIRDNFEGLGTGPWRVTSFQATVDSTVSTAVRRGLVGKSSLRKFETLNVRLEVERKLLGPLITIVLPLLMIGVAALAILQVRDASFRLLGEITVVVFLSIVTYSIAFVGFKPGSDTLTKADLLFGATLMVVLVVFLSVIGAGGKYGEGILPDAINDRLRRWGAILAGLYLATLVIIPLL